MRSTLRAPTVTAMTDVTLETPPSPRLDVWARVFAVLYDPSLWLSERVGMRTHRKLTVRTARMNQVFLAPLSAEEQTLFFGLITRVCEAAEGLRNPAAPLAATKA